MDVFRSEKLLRLPVDFVGRDTGINLFERPYPVLWFVISNGNAAPDRGVSQ